MRHENVFRSCASTSSSVSVPSIRHVRLFPTLPNVCFSFGSHFFVRSVPITFQSRFLLVPFDSTSFIFMTVFILSLNLFLFSHANCRFNLEMRRFSYSSSILNASIMDVASLLSQPKQTRNSSSVYRITLRTAFPRKIKLCSCDPGSNTRSRDFSEDSPRWNTTQIHVHDIEKRLEMYGLRKANFDVLFTPEVGVCHMKIEGCEAIIAGVIE